MQFIAFLKRFIILFLPRNSHYFVQISLFLACRGLAYHDDDILSTMTQNCIGKKEQLTLLGAIYTPFC